MDQSEDEIRGYHSTRILSDDILYGNWSQTPKGRLETTQSRDSTTSPFIYFFEPSHPYHKIRPEFDTVPQSFEEVLERNLPPPREQIWASDNARASQTRGPSDCKVLDAVNEYPRQTLAEKKARCFLNSHGGCQSYDRYQNFLTKSSMTSSQVR